MFLAFRMHVSSACWSGGEGSVFSLLLALVSSGSIVALVAMAGAGLFVCCCDHFHDVPYGMNISLYGGMVLLALMDTHLLPVIGHI